VILSRKGIRELVEVMMVSRLADVALRVVPTGKVFLQCLMVLRQGQKRNGISSKRKQATQYW